MATSPALPLLPDFDPTAHPDERRTRKTTARFIQLLWQKATPRDRRDLAFIRVLVTFSWVNTPEGSESSRLAWRNKELAKWLQETGKPSQDALEKALIRRFRLTAAQSREIVTTATGITDFYHPHRPPFFQALESQAREVQQALRTIAAPSSIPREKVRKAARLVLGLTPFKTPNGGESNLLNGLSPLMACLDPQSRFPIVNAKTEDLLSVVGKKADLEGLTALTGLIGSYGIEDALDLDMYAYRFDKSQCRERPAALHIYQPPPPRSVGFKSEQASQVEYAARSGQIRKQHNTLINRFREAVAWRYTLVQSEYDVLIENWRSGRWLLIEAKTETDGVLGRDQLRQAIGQLFDYRWRSFHEPQQDALKRLYKNEIVDARLNIKAEQDNVDLSLLTPNRPDEDVLKLLKSLKIGAIWFEGDALMSTINFMGSNAT